MKYIKKIPPTDSDFSNMLISTGWKKIKEPSNLNEAILQSIPFMIINGIIFIVIAYCIYPPIEEFINSKNSISITLNINIMTLIYIAITILFMTIHELIHACFIPDFLKSDKTYWGINVLFGFVCTTEKIKKSRYIIISIMPFILLSIIFPLILSTFGLLNEFILFLCLLNAMGSCIDFLNIWNILRQAPNGSYIVNNGGETYYNK
ncbi:MULTISPECIES: DUF3267 domain-containing protein [Clostridium]|uniref:DUF3267 domain-containing protein n=1 Tax=Clostridium TaxID=1485 RepID=UPI0005EAE1B9|nr:MULTISPECIES: DUF3267 domain-containing protein [Clostridium]MBZ0310951.1 DUF3267 domain-containing protein [Clostridium butyricum]MDU2895842.1 DUF3267 domain-containing protein [Clostridium sp.]MDU3008234.1 DUF3267 domain-containing protein [Clostridium sp.]MDU3038754.1 DUF3267 domain-containing protein [Clostridium sp.]MDU3052991.1 DUF3267 domain-containing protein [Clostridium sp.]